MFASPEHQLRRDDAGHGTLARCSAAFVDDLRLLNDTLTGAGLAGRYWIWAGLLIGLAREGWPLAHDTGDADFAIDRGDLPSLVEAIPALRAAGFAPLYAFHTNAGELAELSFAKDGAKFEFFVFDTDGDQRRYSSFADGQLGGPPTQMRAAITRQPLEAIPFVGRTWHKQVDHDLELTEIYGDWRTPDTAWDYIRDDHATYVHEPWSRAAEIPWDGATDRLLQGAVR